MLYGVGQAILAVGALSIGEKKHMEPVRITMVMLMAIFMFMRIKLFELMLFKPLGFVRWHLPDSNWHGGHQALRGCLGR